MSILISKNIALLLTTISIALIQAEPPLTEVSGMSSCMNPGYELYAPALGCLYWKNPYIKNLYEYGPEKSAMVKLVKSLFFIQFDNVTFDITASPIKIARYFTPPDIGKIIGNIVIYQTKFNELSKTAYQHKLKNKKIKKGSLQTILNTSINYYIINIKNTISELSKKISEENRKSVNKFKRSQQWEEIFKYLEKFENIKTDLNLALFREQIDKLKELKLLQQQVEETINKFNSLMNSILKNIVTSKIKGIKNAVIEGLNNTIQREEEQIKRLLEDLKYTGGQDYRSEQFRKELETIKNSKAELLLKAIKKLRENEKLLEQEKKASEVIKNPFLRTEIEGGFAKIVLEALQEEEQGLHPKGVVCGLFLAWLWHYSTSKKDIEIYLSFLSKTINKEIFDKKILDSAPYSKSYYQELTELSAEEIEKFISSKPNILHDWLMFARYGYDLYEKALPDVVPMRDQVKSICEKKFPDCGETSLRNFFNALLYNPLAGQFDTEILEKLNAKSQLIEFYKKYKTPEFITSIAEGKNAYNDWAVVVSGLPHVKYNIAGGCEIQPGVSNMLAVIENLLPGVDTFEALKEKLANYNVSFDISWSSNPTQHSDKLNMAKITIQKPQQKPVTLKWQFHVIHFVVDYDTEIKASYFNNYTEALNASIPTLNAPIKWPYIMLNDLFASNFEYLVYLAKDINLFNIVLLLKTNTPERLLNFVQKMQFLQNSVIDSSLRATIFLKIYSKLQEDNYLIKNFFKDVGGFFYEKVQIGKKKASFGMILLEAAKTDHQKYHCLIRLLNQPYEYSKEDVLRMALIVPTIKSAKRKVTLIDKILAKLSELSKDKDKQEVMKPLYNAIESALPTIKDENKKVTLIEKILIKLFEMSKDKDIQAVIKPLYKAVERALPTVKSDATKVRITLSILTYKDLYDVPEVAKLLYKAVEAALPTIKDVEAKKRISEKILNLKTSQNKDKQKRK